MAGGAWMKKIARYLSNNSSDDCPYDILHCNDYRDTILPEGGVHNQLKDYEQRIVIAWSFGVWVANQVGLSNVTKAIALNGTLSPINTFKGIAPPISKPLWTITTNTTVSVSCAEFVVGIVVTRHLNPWLPSAQY